MKRILWMLVLLLAVAFGNRLFRRSDVAKLQPVEVIRISTQGDQLLVETDTGETGRGETLSAVFADLKAGTAGDIFLDTADYVLLTAAAESYASELLEYLRPACRVCVEQGRAELAQVGAYLDAHTPGVTLMDCQQPGQALPVLRVKEGAMELVS